MIILYIASLLTDLLLSCYPIHIVYHELKPSTQTKLGVSDLCHFFSIFYYLLRLLVLQSSRMKKWPILLWRCDWYCLNHLHLFIDSRFTRKPTFWVGTAIASLQVWCCFFLVCSFLSVRSILWHLLYAPIFLHMNFLKHAINTLCFFELTPSSVSGLLHSYCMFLFLCWPFFVPCLIILRNKVMLILSNFELFFNDAARFPIFLAWFAIETQGSRIAALNQVAKKVAKGVFLWVCTFFCGEVYWNLFWKVPPSFLSSSDWPPLIIMMSHFKKNLSDFFLMNVDIFLI